jgi:hypothetical protein
MEMENGKWKMVKVRVQWPFAAQGHFSMFHFPFSIIHQAVMSHQPA